ncbi:MAG: phosphatidylglycerophosphatase A [Planctomycetes bacterium]|nr:phosphatidylglycerophosphatase A [Planctomycetota bacterium]
MKSQPLWPITTFGLGYCRPFPGTWGSIPTVLIAAALIGLGHGPQQSPYLYVPVMLGVLIFFSAACVVQGDRAEARFGKKDPSQVVADETAGQAIPLLWLPAAAIATPFQIAGSLFAAFVLFRLCDIIKPWPIRSVQSVPGGWGILVDDLLAGLLAAGLLWIGFFITGSV